MIGVRAAGQDFSYLHVDCPYGIASGELAKDHSVDYMQRLVDLQNQAKL
jgi:hypothetical protein